MGRLSMDTYFRRGAAAALLSTTLAGAIAAQSGGTIRRAQGDTVFLRAFGVGKLDTMLVLSRALDHEPYGSPMWLEITRKLDSLMARAPRMSIRQTGPGFAGMPSTTMPRGWLGFNAQGPVFHMVDNDGDHVTYFAYPHILSVDPESPADRAGIVPGDILIAFNGTDVVGHEFNLTRLMEPETKVAVKIRRDGEVKDYSLAIAKAPQGVSDRRFEFIRVPGMPLPPGALGQTVIRIDSLRGDGVLMPDAPRAPGARGGGNRIVGVPRGVTRSGPMVAGNYMLIAPHGVLGADVSTVGADLARVLKLEKGVLVNDVPEVSPAYKSGLRAGDVIVSASGQSVATIGQLQDIIVSQLGVRSVLLQVMRGGKFEKVTATW
jgi:membrane-associated protease RseP (regulator of RpoE activity)